MAKNLTYEFVKDGVDEQSCPVCGSNNLHYFGTHKFETEDIIFIDYKCEKCSSRFSAEYNFSGMYVHKDGRFN